MVLKRKRTGEFVDWEPPSQATMGAPPLTEEAPSPPKKTRSNPPRSVRSGTAAQPVTKPAPVKKPRAPRAKKAAAPMEAPPPPPAVAAQAGPSSQPAASTSVPAKRKGKKKADPDAEPSGSQPEKRGAMFKPKCPQNIWDRVERVMTQRIFMIDRQRNNGELREEFSVLGSTGNVYTVAIDRIPRCNCPDQIKGNHCKHILFVFLKVLQVSQQSELWYQKALLPNELEEIFRNAPLAPNSLAHARIRDAHAKAVGKIPAGEASTSTAEPDADMGKKRIPGEEDDCPICYDGMHGVDMASLTFCEECGNALHKECFGQWQRTAQNNRKDLTCVWCRAPWVVARPVSIGGGKGTPGVAGVPGARRTLGGYGYLNLAEVDGSNISPRRDTSTYYQGPRAGQRYQGWQDYND